MFVVLVGRVIRKPIPADVVCELLYRFVVVFNEYEVFEQVKAVERVLEEFFVDLILGHLGASCPANLPQVLTIWLSLPPLRETGSVNTIFTDNNTLVEGQISCLTVAKHNNRAIVMFWIHYCLVHGALVGNELVLSDAGNRYFALGCSTRFVHTSDICYPKSGLLSHYFGNLNLGYFLILLPEVLATSCKNSRELFTNTCLN